MDLYEHQAKELFATHGVTTQVGKVVNTPEDAQKAAADFWGGSPARAPGSNAAPASK